MMLIAIATLATTARASAATSGPVWGQGPALASSYPDSVMPGITCTSRGNCVAVGGGLTAGTAAIVQVESNGSWGEPVTVETLPASPTPASGSTQDAVLDSVSCASATSCVAVGYYTYDEGGNSNLEPLIVPITISGGTPTLGTATTGGLPTAPDAALDPSANNTPGGDALTSVSCTASGCTAVGFYEDTNNHQMPMEEVGSPGGPWTAAEISNLPAAPAAANPGSEASGAFLAGVSCPAGGACEAIGSYNSSGSSYPWAVTLSGASPTGVEVAMPAGSVPAGPVTEGTYDPLTLATGLSAISCPSAGSCVAAGGDESAAAIDGVAVPILDGTPQPAQAIGGAATEGTVNSIWCSDTADCVAGGVGVTLEGATTAQAVYATETAGSWSSLTDFSTTSADALSIGLNVTCTDVQDCVIPVFGESASAGLPLVGTVIEESAAPLVAGTAALPTATVGQPYTATLPLTGGTGQIDWVLSSGGLPAGLSLNSATGVISGTPTVAGQEAFVASDTDAGPPSQSVTEAQSITVAPAPVASTPAPTVTPTPTPKAVVPTTVTPQPVVRVSYLKVSGTKATVVLSCEGAPCSGTLKLVGTEHLKGSTPVEITAAATAKKTRTKPITLASEHYAISAGASETIRLSLAGKDAKLLTQLHTIHAQLPVTPLGTTKPAVIKLVTFKAAKSVKTKKTGTQTKHH